MRFEYEPETGNNSWAGPFIVFIAAVLVSLFIFSSMALLWRLMIIVFGLSLFVSKILVVVRLKKIAKTGKLTDGKIIRVDEKPTYTRNAQTKSIRVHFVYYTSENDSRRGVTPWLSLYSYKAAEYAADNAVKVAYTLGGAAIIKRIRAISPDGKISVVYPEINAPGKAAGATAPKASNPKPQEGGAAALKTHNGVKAAGFPAAIAVGAKAAEAPANTSGSVLGEIRFQAEAPAQFAEPPRPSLTEPPQAAVKSDFKDIRTLKLCGVKNKGDTVELVAEKLGLSRYDVRTRIETDKEPVFTVSDTAAEGIGEVLERLKDIGTDAELL